jgi:hypothetical protein
MTIHSQTKLISASNIFEMLISAVFPHDEPAAYSPSDFGFEVEEAELAEELSAQIPAQSQEQTPQVNSNDFETVFNWFLS